MPNHPIFAPVFHGKLARVKELLEEDSLLVSIRDAKNLTPLHVAASRGQDEVIQLLLDYGADINGPSDVGEWTPMVFAAYRGHFDAVRVLIKNGAGVTEADGNPIHYAGQRKHKEICHLLVVHGAIDDLVESDDKDLLALFRAAYSYDSDDVKEILERRPEIVNECDRYGRTAMHEACTQGDTKTVRALLKHGADPALADKNGQTPADRASAHRQHAVTRLIEKMLKE